MKKHLQILLLLVFTIFISCTDPYTLRTNNYEEALVIEATITNELKHQEIKITKTYRLEQNTPTIVSGAVVYVNDNLGNNYEFEEQNGIYISVNEFQAQPNVQYKLKIITDDGKSYSSNSETLTNINPIQSIVPTVVSKNGFQGVDMVVNSYDPTNSSKYYRYDYEETHKIIAPKWVPVKAVVTYAAPGSDPPGTIDLVPRTYEAQVCYSTNKSDKIIQVSTNDLAEDRVILPIRFINKTDYTIANRYSIKVTQYVQNLASYTYYKTLNELSGSGSILSQNQPGFFFGNIKSDSNQDEKVIGYFEVASVSSQRIFFNFHDIFPNDNEPKYPYKCDINPENEAENLFKYCFDPLDLTCKGNLVLSLLFNEQSVFYNFSDNKYELYPSPCGDCTKFSSNIIPSFWIN
ncbi:DUF4249 domain-containing protein [Flavobacterium sp. SUN052]|uniref:DUF4249 domain-containing protein n=1 Tax=Flavobacterium sp. SUN052 TaxID=3002441 RepID=UPI00237E4DC8|nr:DUF4249 domain-containing protein [Flavobacterium sp. SUN052]MEC4003066.1 DUF4249 domain-containing protein [Flavobacterium sp. SUN052]